MNLFCAESEGLNAKKPGLAGLLVVSTLRN